MGIHCAQRFTVTGVRGVGTEGSLDITLCLASCCLLGGTRALCLCQGTEAGVEKREEKERDALQEWRGENRKRDVLQEWRGEKRKRVTHGRSAGERREREG